MRAGAFAPGLVREQERLLRADMTVLAFPLWWGGLGGPTMKMNKER